MADVRRSLGEGGHLRRDGLLGGAMRYVYLLQSQVDPQQTYVGSTGNLTRRLAEHNAGKCRHTRKHAPWTCVVALRFAVETKANRFEQYLKTGSGRAFANRHFR
jgi:putative endonuclease